MGGWVDTSRNRQEMEYLSSLVAFGSWEWEGNSGGRGEEGEKRREHQSSFFTELERTTNYT